LEDHATGHQIVDVGPENPSSGLAGIIRNHCPASVGISGRLASESLSALPRNSHTAMNFRIPSADYAKRYADNNTVVRQQVTLPNIIAIPGGLPIKVGNEVVGGVGASGSPGIDEPCVQAGLDKVADQLK
jgi:hypothetical protein